MFSEFSREIETLKPIPVEIYQKIEEREPSLFSELEKYGHLFRNKALLKKLTLKTYFMLVINY